MFGLGAWLLGLLNLAGGAPVDDSAPCPCLHVIGDTCVFTSRAPRAPHWYRAAAPIPVLASSGDKAPRWLRVAACKC